MSLLMPTYFTKHVSDINPEILHKLNIKGIILDIDDTLAPHKCSIPDEEALKWVKSLKENNINLILVSNNFKNRVSKFAKKLDLPYIYMGLKPLSYGVKKAVKYLNLPQEEIILVGDQIFTDIIGANFLKLKSILVDPIGGKKTTLLKIKRFFEKSIRKKIKNNKKLNLNSII